MKELPVGIQTFEDLISKGYLYVDKTKYLYELIRPGKGAYFLSRPRRFGKSLTISTFEAIFKGKKELFEGLYIKENTNYDWETYPVVRIDMSKIPNFKKDIFLSEIMNKLESIANEYQLDIDKTRPVESCFGQLIDDINKKTGKQVVILIDEYDKPIIDRFNQEQSIINRDILRGFYGNLKSHDEHIRFVFVTGISKFAKVSMFSELNNLVDLSMHPRYVSMLGYTKEEMDKYFSSRIKEIAKKQGIEVEKLNAQIKEWYNGYRFGEAEEYVYNPVSVMTFLDTGEFKNYWFQTGTSKMLVDFIKTQKDVPPQEFEALKTDLSNFDVIDIEEPTLEPLMFQAGYLTIKNIEGTDGDIIYTLGYPNKEVEKSFINYLAKEFTKNNKVTIKIFDMVKLIRAGKIEKFLQALKTLFASINYELLPAEMEREQYYNSLLYLIFKLLGLTANAEENTNKGRIDTVVETDDHIYLIEYKVNKTAQIAIDQIKEKQYFEKYQDRGKEIILIGINFDTALRNINDWKIVNERLPL